MADNEQQTFPDEMIRQFLLGQLNAPEQSLFEHALFAGDELEERVRLTELELADDYASARLSKAERDTFRERFLLTADRHAKLQVSAAIHNNFASTTALIPSDSIFQRIANVLNFRRHVWKYAFATLTLVLLLVTAVLLVKKKEHSQLAGGPPIPSRVAPKATATQTPRMTNHSHNGPAPSHGEQTPPLPLHDSPNANVVLASNTALDSSPIIDASREVVTFELVLDQPLVELYDANIATLSGESVFSVNALKRTEAGVLMVELPNSAINKGDFQIALSRGDGSKQSAGTYYFRVR